MADWRSELRAKGHRLTPQREAILSAINELRHATPDQVFEAVKADHEHISLSTVYRSLETLESLGLVRHAHLSDRAPTYHAVDAHEHFHLVCRGCDAVTSVGADRIGAFSEQLSDEFGFTADVGHLTVFGWCDNCKD